MEPNILIIQVPLYLAYTFKSNLVVFFMNIEVMMQLLPNSKSMSKFQIDCQSFQAYEDAEFLFSSWFLVQTNMTDKTFSCVILCFKPGYSDKVLDKMLHFSKLCPILSIKSITPLPYIGKHCI